MFISRASDVSSTMDGCVSCKQSSDTACCVLSPFGPMTELPLLPPPAAPMMMHESDACCCFSSPSPPTASSGAGGTLVPLDGAGSITGDRTFAALVEVGPDDGDGCAPAGEFLEVALIRIGGGGTAAALTTAVVASLRLAVRLSGGVSGAPPRVP